MYQGEISNPAIRAPDYKWRRVVRCYSKRWHYCERVVNGAKVQERWKVVFAEYDDGYGDSWIVRETLSGNNGEEGREKTKAEA
jgi:hypothetical protein